MATTTFPPGTLEQLDRINELLKQIEDELPKALAQIRANLPPTPQLRLVTKDSNDG